MVKASYEARDGQNVASSIDLIPAPGSHQVAILQAERVLRETIPMSE